MANTVIIDQIRNEAVKLARARGWNVDPTRCRVEGIANEASSQTGQYNHWKVIMPLDPKRNPHRSLHGMHSITADAQLLSQDVLFVNDLREPPEVREARSREEDV